MSKVTGMLVFSILALTVFPMNSFGQDPAPAANGVAPAPAAPAAPAENKEVKMADIRKLMNLTGGGDIGKQVIEQMLETFKASNPDIPESFWSDFIKEVDANQLIELNVEIYDKYLIHDDIKGIIQFYESPVGKKFIEVLPEIVRESYAAGQQWGYDIGTKLRKQLEDKGYLKTEDVPLSPTQLETMTGPEPEAAEPVDPKPAQ